ncbi:MAG TPA: class I SAM-dependent methyltransferase [Methylomirabilota bacterium]
MSDAPPAKPRHLAAEYAAQFGDEEVAAAYRHRPPYPPETFVKLESLLGSHRRTVLELGAGTGDCTIGLAPLADSVIAIEPSRPMLERGLRRTAVHRHVEWLAIAAETYAFDRRYTAVVAAEAFHWLDWDRVLPRIATSLEPSGYLILVERSLAPLPWDPDLHALIRTYSTNRDYVSYDTVAELEARRLIAVRGRAQTGPVIYPQRVDDYVESFHSRNGFSRARLSPAAAQEFDHSLTTLVRRYCRDDTVRLPVQARIAWARPVSM